MVVKCQLSWRRPAIYMFTRPLHGLLGGLDHQRGHLVQGPNLTEARSLEKGVDLV